MAIDAISSGAIFSVLRNIQIQNAQIATSSERLSSGFRINRAADDPAGIVRVVSYQTQIRSLNAAATNTQTGISMMQSAEGGLSQIQDLLDDIKNQAIAANNSALTDAAVTAIQAQVLADSNAITDIINATKFNTQLLLTGDTKTLQTGPDVGQTVTVTLPDVATILSNRSLNNAAGTALKAFLDASANDIKNNVGSVDTNLQTDALNGSGDIGAQVTTAGATQSRLQSTLNNLNSMNDATSSALSNLRDTDIAAETVALANATIRQQAGIAVLAQMNLSARSVLLLLAPTTQAF